MDLEYDLTVISLGFLEESLYPPGGQSPWHTWDMWHSCISVWLPLPCSLLHLLILLICVQCFAANTKNNTVVLKNLSIRNDPGVFPVDSDIPQEITVPTAQKFSRQWLESLCCRLALLFFSMTKKCWLICFNYQDERCMWLLFVISCSSHCGYLPLLIGCYNTDDQSTGHEYLLLAVFLLQMQLLWYKTQVYYIAYMEKINSLVARKTRGRTGMIKEWRNW